jgi:hypothetical protein
MNPCPLRLLRITDVQDDFIILADAVRFTTIPITAAIIEENWYEFRPAFPIAQADEQVPGRQLSIFIPRNIRELLLQIYIDFFG